MKIIYNAADPWELYLKTLNQCIEQYSCKSLCEIGGGAFPAISLEQINKQQLDYTILDISRVELDRAPAGYKKVLADICQPDLNIREQYNFIFSKMLAEHVKDPRLFHANVYKLLKPGGIAFHFFPTLYSLPFVINWLLPESIANFLFKLFVCNDPVEHKRFSVHYKWCKGPTRKQISNFESLNYELLVYQGFFGHKYYQRIPLLRDIHKLVVKLLARFPNPNLTSFAFVILRKKALS
ncbi:MAG: class I SAM-dependent methyltransferase [Candidatus Omnitrophica bacterium]|nr:class I SAM-dependent methyltransferase [Candidatus Omnitrophota bacterium]